MTRSLEGSIVKDKDGKGWIARLRYYGPDGRRKEKKRLCATHALAKIKIRELRTEIENEKSERKTFRQLDQFYRAKYVHAARFVGGQKVSGFRQDTDSVRRYLDRALEHFKDKFIDTIKYGDIESYKEKILHLPNIGRHESQRSVSDLNHHLKRLRRLFNVAIEQGWLVSNPFDKGGALIVESFEVERTRVISYSEEDSLLAACDKWRKHIKPVIIFAVETAARRGEIQALKWSSVNMVTRSIRIESKTTKTLKTRLVPMSSRLLSVMRELWRNSAQNLNAPVFGDSDFKKAFNHACADAELTDTHFHDLRHTGITRMLEKGLPVPVVMKISGHTQMRTFMRYVNLTESTVLDWAERLDAADKLDTGRRFGGVA